ncbi:hypothetical protein TrRE_jg12901, partial [Triparma retinervis]
INPGPDQARLSQVPKPALQHNHSLGHSLAYI